MNEQSRITTTGNQPIADIGLRGKRTLTGLQTHPFVRVRGKFDGMLSTQPGTRASAGVDRELTSAAQLPFVLDFAPDGSFQRASGSPQAPQLVARMWTSLGEFMQLRRRELAEHWEMEESDGSGTYVAAYHQASATRAEKRKLRYASLIHGGTFESYEIQSSDGSFDVDAQGMLTLFVCQESTFVCQPHARA